MAYYDHNERFLFGVEGLSLLYKGAWLGDFISLHAVMMQFSERTMDQMFGNYSCRFRIMTTNDRKLKITRAGNECLWFVGTSWNSNSDVPLTKVVENGKTYQVYPDAPNGKILATKIAKGLRVELWHDAGNLDAAATKNYMEKLYEALLADGLTPSASRHKKETGKWDRKTNLTSSETLAGPDVATLAEEISQRFNNEEFRYLLEKLSINYENLPGETLKGKALELVKHHVRHNKETVLLDALSKERSGFNWSKWKNLMQ